MRRIYWGVGAAFAVFALLARGAVAQDESSEGNKLGKLLIRAAPTIVDGKEFPDIRREQSVKDLKWKPRRFYLTLNENDADYLLVVLERREVGTQKNSRTLFASLSIRQGGVWVPAASLESGQQGSWPVAAEKVTGQAEKWVIKNINPSPINPTSIGPWPAGFYVRKGKPNDYVELTPSGTFFLRQWLTNKEGTYRVSGDTLNLAAGGWKNSPKISQEAITENNGDVWTRAPEGPSKGADPAKESQAGPGEVSVDKIIEMVRAKISDDMIILSIRQSNSHFTLTPDVMLRLKSAGVSDTVIKVMASTKP